MSERLIGLRGVCFEYPGGRSVLDGLHFELARGERIGMVDANGSGKTTLLHLMVGLLRPRAGEVEMFGAVRRREEDFREVRERAGLLFQDPEDQLFCPTVMEDVAFGPLNLGRSREEVPSIVARVLGRLGLEGYEERITYKLSGGEKRLVSLACVLAMEPDVLLLDEPAAGLDDATWDGLTEVLGGLDHSMLVVSHDRRFLKAVTDRAVRLHGGKIEPFDLDQPVPHAP